MSKRGGAAKPVESRAQPSQLQARAEDLLWRLRRPKPTRGDVEAVLQRAVTEAVEAIAFQMCERGAKCGMPCQSNDEIGYECEARSLWFSWSLVKRRLWGNLA